MTKVERLQAWVAALRSGKYKQTREALCKPDGFCCLGVYAELVVAEGRGVKHSPGKSNRTFYRFEADIDQNNWESALPDELEQELGLTSLDASYLIDLNDNERKTFAEIAVIIESRILPAVKEQESHG